MTVLAGMAFGLTIGALINWWAFTRTTAKGAAGAFLVGVGIAALMILLAVVA